MSSSCPNNGLFCPIRANEIALISQLFHLLKSIRFEKEYVEIEYLAVRKFDLLATAVDSGKLVESAPAPVQLLT